MRSHRPTFPTIMNSQRHLIAIISSLVAAAVHAGPRTSSNYTISSDTADAGGNRATSASYTNDGSAGLVAGISTLALPAGTAKGGYIGQLFDVVGFTVNASPLTVDEGETRQVSGAELLDDATLLAVDAATVAWGIINGPLADISASGLATAGLVFQDTSATVEGTFGEFTGTLDLTVLDNIPDNFGDYAGDAVGDDWQVQYFGQPPNPNAGPLVDPDGDGQDNLFEFLAGVVPIDANSRFTLKIAPVPDPLHPGIFLSGQQNLIFAPRFTDRTYSVTAKPNLLTGGDWEEINGATSGDNGTERTITDLNATGPAKFYRIEITRP